MRGGDRLRVVGQMQFRFDVHGNVQVCPFVQLFAFVILVSFHPMPFDLCFEGSTSSPQVY